MSKLMEMFDYFRETFIRAEEGTQVVAETACQALNHPSLPPFGTYLEGIGYLIGRKASNEGGKIWRVTYYFSPSMPRPNDGITEAIAVYGKRLQECLE